MRHAEFISASHIVNNPPFLNEILNPVEDDKHMMINYGHSKI